MNHAPRQTDGSRPAPLPIDRQVLRALREAGGDALIVSVIDVFIEQTPTLLEAMRAGHDSGDLETVRRAAHSLKSSSGSLGATHLSALAARAERSAAEGRDGVVAGLIDELDAEWPPVKDDLGRIREGGLG